MDTSLCIKSSLVIDLSVVLSCKSVARVSIWKNSLSTVCSVSAMLFIRFIPPSSCFHKLKDFVSVYKCYFPIVHAHSYFPCPNIHPPKKRNPDPIKEAMWNDILRRKSKMAQYWSCHLQSFNSWYFSVLYLWLGGDIGHRAGCEWGVVALPKGSHFLCWGFSFLIKTGRAKICFRENWMEQLLDVLVVQLLYEVNLSLTETPTVLAF